MEVKAAIIHTVLGSEKEAFTNHINQVLKDDADVKNRLPIKSELVFDALEDGILLCKIINEAVPGKVPPISPQAINLQPSNLYHKIENLNLAIESARSIGCMVVNIQPQFIIEKREHIVLGLMWQIHISNQLTLKRYPELIILKKEDEPDDIMTKLGYEETLLRWLNYHVAKNGGNRTIHNLGKDMIDGYAYGNVMQNVATASFDNSYWDKTDQQKAQEVIRICQSENIKTTIKPNDITSGNPRLNTILCMQIFNQRHGLEIQSIKIVQLPPEPETDQTREIRVFKNWINSQGLQDTFVNYLIDDLKDGTILLKVIDNLRPNTVDWKKYSNKTNSRIHIIQNCNYVVQICKQKLHLIIIGVGGMDIVDGKVSLTLGVVWQICKLYWDERVGTTNDETLIAWGNQRVPQEHKITSFKDKSLRNCMFLLNIIESIQPKTVNFSKVKEGDSDQDQVSKINYTLSAARKLGCQIITLWQHINENNVKYVSLFVAELQNISKKHKKS